MISYTEKNTADMTTTVDMFRISDEFYIAFTQSEDDYHIHCWSQQHGKI